jgi:DNA primase
MDALDLKKHIIENNLIMTVLEKLQCHSIKPYPLEYRAGLPDHGNPTGISVKKDTLKTTVYSSEKEVGGDIFTLIMKIKSISFPKSVVYMHKLLGIPYELFSKPIEKPYNPIDVFTSVLSRSYDYNATLKVYDEKMLKPFINLPNIWWLKEGIPPNIQEKFKLGYCPQSHRITIPQRYWCGGENDYIGCKGRTIFEEWELLGIPKFSALVKFSKTLNVYGLQENYEAIQKAGEVIVFEAEKSVLKMASWGYNNAVAISGHELSIEQIKILIGLDVDIVIAYDKDITEGFIKEACGHFTKMRRTSYIFDRDDVLDNKMSPVDKRKRTFDFLYKHRIAI